jgi:hypothetical protein
MTLEEALYYHLVNNAGVAALITTRVYPNVIPEDVAQPAAAYQVISRIPILHHNGPSGLETVRVQITCRATTYAVAKSVAVAIVTALDGFSGAMGGVGGVTVEYSHVENEQDGYNMVSGSSTMRLDVIVMYQLGNDLFPLGDEFITALGVGAVDGTLSEPGHGKRVVTDVESVILTLGGALRGGGQPASAVWGECRLVWTDDAGAGFARAQGRAFSAIVIPADYFANNWWIALATTQAPNAPDTAGFGIWQESVATVKITIPSGFCYYAPIVMAIQPEEMLVTIIEQSAGFYLLMSAPGAYTSPVTTGVNHPGIFGTIPAYPNARLWWVDRADTTSPLYPVISWYNRSVNYPNGFYLADARIVDLAGSWATFNGIAYKYDTYTDSDGTSLAVHTADTGGGWSLQAGATWTINSGKLSRTDGVNNGVKLAMLTTPPASADGLVKCKVDCPPYAGGSTNWGIVLRYQDVSNYIALISAGGTVDLVKVVANSQSNIALGGEWTQNTTVDMAVYMEGDKYRVIKNNIPLFNATDATFMTAAGLGLMAHGVGTEPTFDDLVMFPLTMTLPTEIQSGRSNLNAMTPGATIASDTFTGGAGHLEAHTPNVGGAWVADVGQFELDGAGMVSCTSGTGTVTMPITETSIEVSVDITTPADPAHIVAGIVCYIDATHYFLARIIRDDTTQPTFHEIEVIHHYDGYSDVCHKAGLGNFYTANTTYSLKMQITPTLVRVFLDGNFLNSYIPPVALSTKVGLHIGHYSSDDNGCKFDNWVVKSL